jgi:hypothetical protein
MKKLGFGLSVFLFVATAFASGASAADNITDKPKPNYFIITSPLFIC